MLEQKKSLQEAIKILKNKSQLAARLGTTRQSINYWLNRNITAKDDICRPKHAIKIEILTDGRVKKEQLCPATFTKKE